MKTLSTLRESKVYGIRVTKFKSWLCHLLNYVFLASLKLSISELSIFSGVKQI